MARPRLKKYQTLPPNLIYDTKNKQYRYRNITTGKYHQMGKDRLLAVKAAQQLNSMLMSGQELVAKVLGTHKTLEQFLDERFLPHNLPEREASASTLRDYHNKLPHIRNKLGKLPIKKITVKHIADFLAQFPNTQSNRYRSLLSVIFKYAVAEGFAETNPVHNTIKRKERKKRNRMTLTQFKAIHKKAGELGLGWLQNAMDIGLITLQRENDILLMKFEDIIQETVGNKKIEILKVIQKKTEKYGASAHIKIRIGNELKTIITRCHDKTLSPYLVHHLPERIIKSKERVHHTQILPDHFRKIFRMVRDQTGLFNEIDIEARPTFHEIRSLGIKLYEDQGNNAQTLAGHTTRAMTEQYKKGHEEQWTYAESV